MTEWLETLGLIETNMAQNLVAVAVLIIGVVFAIAVRVFVLRVAHTLEQREDQLRRGFAPAIIKIAHLAFWLLLFIAVISFLTILGVDPHREFMNNMIGFLPTAIIGLFIVAVGHFIGITSRDLILRALSTHDLVRYAARASYVCCFGLGLIIGIQHVGIDIWYIAVLTIVLISISLAALGFAFALGAKEHIANLIAYRTLQDLNPGERIRIDQYTGTVVEVQRTAIVINTSEGRAYIPPSLVSTTTLVRLADDE